METKFKKVLLIFVLLISFIYKANEGNKGSFNVFKNENYNEITKKTKTFYSNKYNLSYDITVGSDLQGNITNIDIQINTIVNDQLKFAFIKAYREMLSKFTVLSKDGKKNLIYPEESCLIKCNTKWDCAGKPTNAGVLLCTGDCIDECYL